MVGLRVTYARDSELRQDADQELARGVLLVRVDAPGMQFRDEVALEIVAPRGSVRWVAEVLNVIPGHGVAVSFPAARLDDVKMLAPPGGGDAPGAGAAVHEVMAIAPAAPATSAQAGIAEAATAAEKIRTALHGTRDERAAILRDKNRSLHAYVLKNPNVTLDEITAFAKNAQMSPEFLKLIAERKEWLGRPAIAVALARNPKTPPEVAVRALDFVPVETLRQMAKGIGALPHITQAARKKVIAP